MLSMRNTSPLNPHFQPHEGSTPSFRLGTGFPQGQQGHRQRKLSLCRHPMSSQTLNRPLPPPKQPPLRGLVATTGAGAVPLGAHRKHTGRRCPAVGQWSPSPEAGQEVGWSLGCAEVGSGTPGLLQARRTHPLGDDAWGSRSPASPAAWHHLLPLGLCCWPGYVAHRQLGTWE